jgi:hypothetical protein
MDDEEELHPAAFLRDLSERLMRVPIMFGVDQGDCERLERIAMTLALEPDPLPDDEPPHCIVHGDRQAVTNLDGENLCSECADAWVRAEGSSQAHEDARRAIDDDDMPGGFQ